jgi:hypothetical protein
MPISEVQNSKSKTNESFNTSRIDFDANNYTNNMNNSNINIEKNDDSSFVQHTFQLICALNASYLNTLENCNIIEFETDVTTNSPINSKNNSTKKSKSKRKNSSNITKNRISVLQEIILVSLLSTLRGLFDDRKVYLT